MREARPQPIRRAGSCFDISKSEVRIEIVEQTIYAPETLQGRLTEDNDLFNSAFEEYGDELDPGTDIERMLNIAVVS